MYLHLSLGALVRSFCGVLFCSAALTVKCERAISPTITCEIKAAQGGFSVNILANFPRL